MKKAYSLMLSVVLILLVSTQVNAQLVTKKTIGLELAKKLVAAAEAQAIKDNLQFVITIVDDGGNVVCLERMDGAQLGSIEISMKKAQTSLNFKRPTKSYQDRITAGTNAIIALQNVLPFEGGLPLFVDGQLVGAIGVSGGTSDQDGVVAKAAADFLAAMK